MFIQPVNKSRGKSDLVFQARVDKGLERFYEVNKKRMPVNVWRYIDGLADKSGMTPLEAQGRAFIGLKKAQTIQDVQTLYPDEPAFSELRDITETKSSKGILMHARELAKDLKELGSGILENGENLTVYLVRKIFMEGKTVPEINKDLDNDLSGLFKSELDEDNIKSDYISRTNLKTLGIKMPAMEYINSLKFTRDGYSDEFGQTISLAQRIFWDSLSEEEKTARAKKSVARFENWWSGLSQDKKLEMVAAQDDKINMLKDFKASQKPETAQKAQNRTEETAAAAAEAPHTKVGSQKLSQDDLFKRWAANNLKIFEEGLSEEDKIKLNEKRMRNAADRWNNMSPEEKTDYISRLKTGSESLRYVMINAWNNCLDLIKELSDFLSEKQITKAEDMLYSKEGLSEYMSRVMTEFWAGHSEEAKQFGAEISKSWEKVNNAISDGRFEQLKTEVSQKKKQRIEELQRYKTSRTDTELENYDLKGYSEKALYQSIDKYYGYTEGAAGILLEFADDLIKTHIRSLDEKQRKMLYLYTKYSLAFSEFDDDLKETIRANHARLKTALVTAACALLKETPPDKEQYDDFLKELPVRLNRKYNMRELKEQYKFNKTSLTPGKLQQIMNTYFKSDKEEDLAPFRELLTVYGNNALNIFSKDSPFSPSERKILYKNMKDDFWWVKYQGYTPNKDIEVMESPEFDKKCAQEELSKLLHETCPFLPEDFMKTYQRVSCDADDEFLPLLKIYLRMLRGRKVTGGGEPPHSMPDLPDIDKLPLIDKIKFLAVEEAMADVLSEFCVMSDGLYKYKFEDLCNVLTTAYNDNTNNVDISGGHLYFRINKRPAYPSIKTKYKSYLNECIQWLKEPKTDKNKAIEDLLFILNPDDANAGNDREVLKRIKKYNVEADI